MLLNVKPSNLEIKELYTNHGSFHKGDSGLDLYIPEDIIIKKNSLGSTINMKVSCEANKTNIGEYITDMSNILNSDTLDDSRELVELIFKKTIQSHIISSKSNNRELSQGEDNGINVTNLSYDYSSLNPREKKLYESLANLNIKTTDCSYYLYPRSSISKTPLRMSNSVGIIDAGYRGEIIAKVDNLSNDDYKIEKGTRLFQICDASLEPIELRIVDKLSETTRGVGGFGSTG